MDTGLTSAQAEELLKKHGYNELPQGKEGFFDRVKELFSEPMIILLLVGSGLYFVLGEISDAIPLLLSVVAVIIIDLYEENKAEKALESLRQIGSPKANVLRNGEPARIPSREVVIGDHLILSEGDRIAADAEVLQTMNLSCDEAMLTGESITVPKLLKSPVFMGTLVTTGHGLAVVTSTAAKTEMGKIGKSLEEIKIEPSPSKAEAGKLVKKIAVIGLTLCLSLVLYYGVKNGNWIQGVLAGITLAMSVLPEEIPVVLAIFTILGAFRMSKKRVLAKRSSVIETLGATTVICLDKTGTITQNKMQISRLYIRGKDFEIDGDNIPDEFDELIKYSVLASRKRAVDPIEKAITDLGERAWGTKKLFEDWKHLTEEPHSEKIMAVSQVWEEPNGTQVVAIKGAPEAIFELCRLNPFEKESLTQTVTELAESGLRVLAVAKNGSGTPEFLGLLGFSDPIRPAIKNAILECF